MMGHLSILYTEFVIFKKSLIIGSFIETYAGENTFSWHNGLISRLQAGEESLLHIPQQRQIPSPLILPLTARTLAQAASLLSYLLNFNVIQSPKFLQGENI